MPEGEKKKYLSFGGGVNSTALMLYLLDRGEEFEAVYSDHQTDYPDTINYIHYLREGIFGHHPAR